MSRTLRAASFTLTVSSGFAFGVLAMTGLFAALIFPTVRDLDPSLPAYVAYDGPHWSLAAGVVAERVFRVGLPVAGIAVLLALLAALVLTARRDTDRFPVARLGLSVVCVALLAAQALWLQPRMNTAAEAYRDAAISGDNTTAQRAKAEFDAMHPTASRLLGSGAIASMALFLCSAWSGSRGCAAARPEASPGK